MYWSDGQNWSRAIVKLGPFCRKGLSPQGEPMAEHPLRDDGLSFNLPGFARKVATSCEVLLGKEDLQELGRIFVIQNRVDDLHGNFQASIIN